MNSRRCFAAAIVGVAALFVLGSSAARADDFFAGCSKNSNGKVRKIHVNSFPICKSTETLRVWNQTGPQGPPGFSSCAPEEVTGTAQASTFAVLNYTCSSGKAVGASAIWHTPFDAADNGPFYLLPRSDTMWTVVPYNHTLVAQDFRFFVQCCQ